MNTIGECMGERADIILANGIIVTLSRKGIIYGGSIAINGNKIAAIGRSDEILSKYYSDEVIDVKGKVVLPGLIDLHVHNVQILLRGSFTDKLTALPPIWLNFLIPFEANLTPDQVKTASLFSMVNMIKNGTTCFVEAGSPYPEKVAEAVLETGMRGIITRSNIDLDPNIPMYTDTERIIRENLKLYDEWHGRGNGRIEVWFSVREIMLNTIKLIDEFNRLARERNTYITMHLAEDRVEVDFTLEKYGKRPVELMFERGYLNDRVLAVHMIFLNSRETIMVAKSGASIVWCPYVDSYLMGLSKAIDLLELNVTVGLGSDGGAWCNMDLFEQGRIARTAAKLLSNMISHDKTALPAKTVLYMLTRNAAKAIHKLNLGVLEEGYLADIIVLDIDRCHLTPHYNIEEVIVNMARGSDVNTVIIDGKVVMRDRKILTVSEERVVKEFSRITDKVQPLINELRKRVLKLGREKH